MQVGFFFFSPRRCLVGIVVCFHSGLNWSVGVFFLYTPIDLAMLLSFVLSGSGSRDFVASLLHIYPVISWDFSSKSKVWRPNWDLGPYACVYEYVCTI
ncbi:hypothetical protein M432DRAFT_201706 [Thermoascus aurantiacus ATCC 26904]